VIFEFLFPFLICGLVGIINPMFFAWITSKFMSDDKAQIAGFSFWIGMLITGPVLKAVDTLSEIGAVAGALTGTAFVWFQFFRRKTANG
jgi:hypothetical protein